MTVQLDNETYEVVLDDTCVACDDKDNMHEVYRTVTNDFVVGGCLGYMRFIIKRGKIIATFYPLFTCSIGGKKTYRLVSVDMMKNYVKLYKKYNKIKNNGTGNKGTV